MIRFIAFISGKPICESWRWPKSQEFSWALSVQQRSGRLTAAMAGNCCGEIGQNVQALQVAGFGNSQQASRGELALGAAVDEADLTPLYPRAEGPFNAVVHLSPKLHPP